MTPFELELFKTFWPWMWTGMLGAAGIYLKASSAKLTRICAAMDAFAKDVNRIEKEMLETKGATQHKLDTLIGATNTRLSTIETVCQAQHGVQFKRRAEDNVGAWAQTSDIQGVQR